LKKVSLANLQIPATTIIEIFKVNPNLTSIDISDISLGDEGIIQLCTHLTGTISLIYLYLSFFTTAAKLKLTDLIMNRVWNKRTKARDTAISSLCKLLDESTIKKLHMVGGGRSQHQLRRDLLKCIFHLMNNKHLVELDISGHQVEDGKGNSKVVTKKSYMHV